MKNKKRFLQKKIAGLINKKLNDYYIYGELKDYPPSYKTILDIVVDFLIKIVI